MIYSGDRDASQMWPIAGKVWSRQMLLNRQVETMLGVAAIAALASAQDQVEAATATLEVSATVANACTVESGSLAFGAYQAGPQAPSLQGSGVFNVQCTSPGSIEIKLDGGLNEGAGGDARAMKGPGDSYLNYVHPTSA